MSELKALTAAASQLRARGQSFLSATVVRVRGSGYRRPGARMLADETGLLAGSISGGCLERDVATRGAFRTRSSRCVLVTYNEGEDALDERSGSGCQGVIDVLVERHDPADDDVFALMQRCLREETRALNLSVFRSTHPAAPVGARLTLREGEYTGSPALREAFEAEAALALAERRSTYVSQRICAEGEIEALVEVIEPPPHLFVFGSGHDVGPLIGVAQQVGWSCSVWDAQPRISTRERLRAADHYWSGSLADVLLGLNGCARPIAVVMGHHLEQDRAVLRGLLDSRAHYIGVLGPRRRTEQMLADCQAEGLSIEPATRARIYAPVGLALGAETPAEIALAIVAEAQSVLTQSDARALRSDPGSIHPRALPAREWTLDAE
ncbi:MAG TPA: XdhC family protein [Polyangiales bacterium]|nr:XdhC family protein [Polyangiales bacterium]